MSPRPEFSPRQLKQTKAREYVQRFVLGGAISVLAAIVGSAYGPRVGGLFLAFPAILPASLTLVKEHQGRRAAADDARGASLGSLGLAGFGLSVAVLADDQRPAWTLLSALAVWLVVSVSAWWLLGHARCTSNVSQGDTHHEQ